MKYKEAVLYTQILYSSKTSQNENLENQKLFPEESTSDSNWTITWPMRQFMTILHYCTTVFKVRSDNCDL